MGVSLEKSNSFLISLLFNEIMVSFTRFSEMLSHTASICLLFCLGFFSVECISIPAPHPAFFKWSKLCQFSCTRPVLWTQFFRSTCEISFMTVYMVMPIKPCTLEWMSFSFLQSVWIYWKTSPLFIKVYHSLLILMCYLNYY